MKKGHKFRASISFWTSLRQPNVYISALIKLESESGILGERSEHIPRLNENELRPFSCEYKKIDVSPFALMIHFELVLAFLLLLQRNCQSTTNDERSASSSLSCESGNDSQQSSPLYTDSNLHYQLTETRL